MLTELKSKYYVEQLKKTGKVINSPYSLLGIHHAHLNEFVRGCVNKLPAGSTILDGGCGLSIWVTDEIRKKYNLYSVDCQIESVEFCRSYYQDDRYFLADLYSLTFDESFFDAMVLREVIEHIKEPERAIREISRILKKDGLLILTTPNYSSSLLFFVENIYNRFFSEIKPYLNDVHPSKFKFDQLRQLLEKYFSIVDYGTIDFGLNISAVVRK